MISTGDLVLYREEAWEVGFINIRHRKGTVRLQKNGSCYSKQINYVPIGELELIHIEDNKVYAQTIKEVAGL